MAWILQGRIDRLWRFLALAIVLIIGVIFYVDWRAFQAAARQVDETRQLQQQTDTLLSSITDAETGERGYLLTGDAKYLAPYQKAVADLPGELVKLANTAAAAHREVRQVAYLQTLVRDKMSDLKRTITVRDEAGAEAALALMRTDEGRLTMEEVRSACKVLLSTEYFSLYQLDNASESHANGFLIVVLAGCIGLVLLLWRLGAAVDSVVREREESAHTIEEARQLLQTTLTSIGDAVIVTDAAGVVRFMNPVAEKLTGSVALTTSKTPLDKVFYVVDERSRRKIDRPFPSAEHGKAVEPLPEHSILIPREGGEISIEGCSAPIRDASGKGLGVVLVFRDVTARRIAERDLEHWKQVFSGAAFGMFIADSREGVIIDLNPTFAAMHGYSVEELLGKSLTAVAPRGSTTSLRRHCESPVRTAGICSKGSI